MRRTTRQVSFCGASLLLFAHVACVAKSETGSAQAALACGADAECGGSDFCDLGACATRSSSTQRGVSSNYGHECTPAQRTEGGVRDGKVNACGSHVCRDGRCRSCTSDEECVREYGGGTCAADAERGGKRCQ
jgi:hypothetical protein